MNVVFRWRSSHLVEPKTLPCATSGHNKTSIVGMYSLLELEVVKVYLIIVYVSPGKARVLAQWSIRRQEIGRPWNWCYSSNKKNDLSNHLVASAGDEFSVNLVEATKGFDQNGACVMVNPRLVINYSNDDTNVKLTASFIGFLLCSRSHGSHSVEPHNTSVTNNYDGCLSSIKPV
jgi:hypothetical protein